MKGICHPIDVEGSSSTFAPAASDAFLLVLVPDPGQPQQSQTSLSSQTATLLYGWDNVNPHHGNKMQKRIV